MKMLKPLFLAMLLPAFSAMSILADVPVIPDFAFPAKVIGNSDKTLSKALKDNDNPQIVQALIDGCIAENSIDKDNACKVLHRMDSITAMISDPTLKSMLNALQARLLTEIYIDNRYVYDQRVLPAENLSDDIFLWSGTQFRNRIMELTDISLEDASSLQHCPISQYAANISFDDVDEIYYPTLYDFIAYQAIQRMNSISTYPSLVGRIYLDSAPAYIGLVTSGQRINATTIYARKTLELYAALLDLHEKDVPAYIHADLGRINFVYTHLFNDTGNSHKLYISILKDLYSRYSVSEYSCDILLDIARADFNAFSPEKWLEIIDNSISSFPSYKGIPYLRNIRDYLTQKSVEISLPQTVCPGGKVEISITMNNVNHAYLSIYDISRFINGITDDSLKNLVPIARLPLTSLDRVPFKDEQKLQFAFPNYGRYRVIPTYDNSASKNYADIYVTSLAAVTRENAGERSVLVIDRETGTAVNNAGIATVSYTNRRSATYGQIGHTDTNGLFKLTESDKGGQYAVVKGDDRYAPTFYISSSSVWQKRESMKCNFYPSLPVYHQGDTLEWAAMLYQESVSDNVVSSGKDVTVTLSDVNRQVIDTLCVRTDSYGRVNGRFVIPEDRLTGYYTLSMRSDGYNIGSCSVMVSDYVMPSFRLSVSPAENNAPSEGDVTLRGEVMTYSGFGMGDTPVSLKLMNVAPFSYFRNTALPYDMTFYTDTISTDAQGRFSIVIPQAVISDAPMPGALFIAELSCTSASGESQSASTSFMLRPSYRLNLSAAHTVVQAPSPLVIPVVVTDYQNEPVDIALEYTVVRNNGPVPNDTIISDVILPADKKAETGILPSGCYSIIISPVDKTLASPVTLDVVIYRITDDSSPVDDMIWSPTGTTVHTDKSGKFTWLYAVNDPLIIHYAIATSEGITEYGSFNAKRGLNTWEYAIPDRAESCKINLVSYKNNNSTSMTLTAIAPPKESPIKIKAETFRDRVTPSSSETWTFYIEDYENTPQEAAVMMRMYNAALEALSQASWTFPKHYSYIPLSVRFQDKGYTFGESSNRIGLDIYRYPSSVISFNTYNNPLFANNFRIRGTRMMKAAATSYNGAIDDLNIVREHHDEVMVESIAASAVMNNAVMEESSTDYDTGVATASGSPDDDSFSYRDAEVPVAFFRPMLVTDSNGKLTVKFTVPNANTTWRINTIAFTKSMNNTEFNASVIASKPVMVSPVVPQFVRKGDKVEFKALVMNATDSIEILTTEIELYNPVDNKIISKTSVTDTVIAKTSVTASCIFEANLQADIIGYRIESSTKHFADGEAGAIPVLPSSTPVITTTPFYIAPGCKDYSLPIEKSNGNAVVTLEYTENPAWYVVSALPGLLSTDCSTAPQAAVSIFSAAIADGLAKANPSIEIFLREWMESDRSDSTFISMLERNPDLKIMILNATPWMADASNDVERMSRLALLFDRKEISKVYDTDIELLSSLVSDDGGLRWMGQSENASEWATANVLMLMGRLNRLGYLPDDERLNGIISGALDYLDGKVAERLAKYPSSTFQSYAMIMTMFPDHVISENSMPAIENTLKAIRENWKSSSVAQKAFDAILLHRFKDKTLAKTILNSIREFAVYTPEKGMWWPSVGQTGSIWHVNIPAATATIMEAFDEIDPAGKEVEQIRQWLILQKEATDWKQSVSTSIVIATILKSSADWLKPAGEVKFNIGNQQLIPRDIENATGYFRTNISSYVNDNASLCISRSDATASSWGAIYRQSIEKMDEIAESSIEGLSISKNILRYCDTTIEDALNFTVGDKVSVQLTIVNDRDMDYVAIEDCRAACLRPVQQLPKPVVSQGIYFYIENRTDRTRIFIDHLPRGRYILSYDLWVTNGGEYSSGIATIQSQYAPQLSAHSGGSHLIVADE